MMMVSKIPNEGLEQRDVIHRCSQLTGSGWSVSRADINGCIESYCANPLDLHVLMCDRKTDGMLIRYAQYI